MFHTKNSETRLKKDLEIAGITHTDLQDEIKAPIIMEEYREEVTKRMEDGAYMNIFSGYPSSVFQDFESYLREEIHLVEDDIKFCLVKWRSGLITYEIQPGIYTFNDVSEALYNILQPEYPASSSKIVMQVHDITRKINWL